ncbi:MAG: hypothetical protein LBT86_02790 [Deltaproteobacteria bacterium]|jgi:hypothetical protein|nr:hypothetical protein [Deltaproteobacteria bacterium]
MSKKVTFLSSSKTAGSFTITTTSNFWNYMVEDLVPAFLATLTPANRPTITVVDNWSDIWFEDTLDNPSEYPVFFSADDVRPSLLVKAATRAVVQSLTDAEGQPATSSTKLTKAQIVAALLNFGWNSPAVADWNNAPRGQATKEFVQTVQGSDDGAQNDSTNASLATNNGFNRAKFSANDTNIGSPLNIGEHVDGNDIGFDPLFHLFFSPSCPTEKYGEIPSDNDLNQPERYRPIYQDLSTLQLNYFKKQWILMFLFPQEKMSHLFKRLF